MIVLLKILMSLGIFKKFVGELNWDRPGWLKSDGKSLKEKIKGTERKDCHTLLKKIDKEVFLFFVLLLF